MWKWMLMVLAVLGAVFALVLSRRSTNTPPVPAPLKEPVRNPYKQSIAGAGIVEAASENVVIGVSDPGRVAKVYVTEGDNVKTGDPLFQLDTRSLEADLVAAKAAVETSQADLRRVKAFHRKEDEAALRAKVAEAVAAVAETNNGIAEAEASAAEQEWSVKDQQDQVARLEITVKTAATPEEQLIRARFALETAQARLTTLREKVKTSKSHAAGAAARQQAAQVDLDTLLAGPWDVDVLKAQAAVDEAQSKVKRIEMEIERRMVRATMDSVVIRARLHAGEYLTTTLQQPEDAPIVLGNLKNLNVRVDIDEFDAQRFQPGMKASALLKNGSGDPIPLDFDHVEPYVIPKRALTNAQRELVDTRVLQVVYRVTNVKAALFVGQQLDVFIDTSSVPAAAPAGTGTAPVESAR
jgi:HlyD family secretion protein